MAITASYRDKTFTIADPDARIRRADDLLAFERDAAGAFRVIPRGAQVTVDAVRVVAAGTSKSLIFAHARPAGGGADYGWTAIGNVRGGFVNETLGEIAPEPGAGQFAATAAWSGGAYLGQRTLVEIVDAAAEVERIALDTLGAYFGLVAAGAADGVAIAINSGFRTWAEQKMLYDGYVRHLPASTRRPGPASPSTRAASPSISRSPAAPAIRSMTG